MGEIKLQDAPNKTPALINNIRIEMKTRVVHEVSFCHSFHAVGLNLRPYIA